MSAGEALDRCPLWEGENPLADLWAQTRPQILAQGDGWRFWVDWYDNALLGRPQDYELLTKIALIDSADWGKGADHVNALIAEIRLNHIAESRPLGEDAIEQGPDGLWHRVGRSDIDRDILQDAMDSVSDEIRRLRGKLLGPQGNMFTALVGDVDLLDERLARYPDRPLRLHDTFLRVQANILYNLDQNELPDDVLVRDLNSALGTAAMDMRNACPKTKSVVEARISARFDEGDGRARADLAQLADGAAERSDSELGHEFKADKETAFDPNVPEHEKKAALYRLTTRLSLMLTRDAKNIIDAVVLLGGIGAGVTTFGYMVSLILRFVIF
ncbi:MAG: hypothetical protein EA339_00540 [Rhodobacteraceae bacterium]|nr:MAG: hypothetical protein EA339_00540 [Paracoccaceae bacterium]